GAVIPSRIWFPRIATTLTRMLSPMTTPSPSLRLNTSIFHTPQQGDFNPMVSPTPRRLARQLLERVEDLGDDKRFAKDLDGPHLQQGFFRVGPQVPGRETAAEVRAELLESGQGVRAVQARHQHIEQDHGNLMAMPAVQLEGLLAVRRDLDLQAPAA